MTETSSVPDGPHALTTAGALLTAANWLVPFKGIHMSSFLNHFFWPLKRRTADRR